MATEQRETASLIGSDKVEGTTGPARRRQALGSLERVMIDKLSGKVAYAVMSYGGFLGIGDDHYRHRGRCSTSSPAQWLRGQYHRRAAERRAKVCNDNYWEWSRENDQRVYDYYRVTPFWGAA